MRFYNFRSSSANNTAETKTGEDTFFSSPGAEKTSQSASSFFSNPSATSPVQTKPIHVGQPGDKYEQEADAMADRVTGRRGSATVPSVQTKCASCQEEEVQRKAFESEDEEPVQRKEISGIAASGESGGQDGSEISGRLNARKGTGQKLEEGTLREMEPAFGSDFSGVRVHTDGEAQEMSQQLQAKAFTHREDVYFNRNAYAPETASGKHLLVHELTHVVQQNGDTLRRKPDEQAVTTEPKNEPVSEEKPLKPLGYNSLYWLVDFEKVLTIGQLRTTATLRDMSNYLYGTPAQSSTLAQVNKIDENTELKPGHRLIVGGGPLRHLKNNPVAVKHFHSSPQFSVYMANPQAVLTYMGVADPIQYMVAKKKYEQQLEEDFKFIVRKLDESHYSDSDEGMVIYRLRNLAQIRFVPHMNRFHKYPQGGFYLDAMFTKLKMKMKVFGVIVDQWTSYYSLIFNHFDRVNEVIALQQQYSTSKKDRGTKEVSFFDEVIVRTVKGLPGGITAGVGGLIESLPGDTAEDIGGWLKGKSKDYLKAVNYGDDKMIDQAVEGSALSGGLLGEGLQMIRGGPIPKIISTLEALQKADQILELKDQLLAFTDVQKHLASVQGWMKDPSQLMFIMMGLENPPALSKLESWVDSAPSKVKSKAKGKKDKGIKKLIQRIVKVINKIKKLLQPIFEMRRKMAEYLSKIGLAIAAVPEFMKVLEFIDSARNNPDLIKRELKKFSKAVGIKVQEMLNTFVQQLHGHLSQIESLISDLKITNKEVSDIVTKFALDVVGKKVKMVKVVGHIDKVRELVSEHLISHVIPGEALSVVNMEIDKVTSLTRPAFSKAHQMLKEVHQKVGDLIQKELLPRITQLLVQRSPDTDASMEFPSAEELNHQMSASKGDALPFAVRGDMESQFQQDFSNVRVHRDEPAQDASANMGARAFTLGNHIYFKEGAYDPASQKGKHLLAHELTHTVQQGNGATTVHRAEDDLGKKVTERFVHQIEDWIRLLRKGGTNKKEIKSLNKLYKHLVKFVSKPVPPKLVQTWKTTLGFSLLEIADDKKYWTIRYSFGKKRIQTIRQYKRHPEKASGNAEEDWASIQAGMLLDLTGYVNDVGATHRINPNFISKSDKKKRTNKKRMKQGLSPYLQDRVKVELHHTSQNFFSKLDEVSSTHHALDYDDLHDMAGDAGYISWRGEIAYYNKKIKTLGQIYNSIRGKHWRKRAKDI